MHAKQGIKMCSLNYPTKWVKKKRRKYCKRPLWEPPNGIVMGTWYFFNLRIFQIFSMYYFYIPKFQLWTSLGSGNLQNVAQLSPFPGKTVAVSAPVVRVRPMVETYTWIFSSEVSSTATDTRGMIELKEGPGCDCVPARPTLVLSVLEQTQPSHFACLSLLYGPFPLF